MNVNVYFPTWIEMPKIGSIRMIKRRWPPDTIQGIVIGVHPEERIAEIHLVGEKGRIPYNAVFPR